MISHGFANFSHDSARESAVKKGLKAQAMKEASLHDESVGRIWQTDSPDFPNKFPNTCVLVSTVDIHDCALCMCLGADTGDTYPYHRSLQHYLSAVHDAPLLL